MIEKSRAEIRAAIGAKFEESKQEAHVPDQVMVSASAAALEDMEKKGYTILRPLHGTEYHLVRIPTGRTVESAIDELSNLPGVTDAEKDSVAEPGAQPNDPYWANDLVMVVDEVEYRYTSQKRLMAYMDVDAYWDRLTRYPGPITPNKIAVIDTGYKVDHEDLAGQFVLPGYNSADGSDDITPSSVHGTNVAGVIAAIRDNNIGVAGFGAYSKVYPIKYRTAAITPSISTTIAAINHCVLNNIRVINLSSGWSTGSTALEQACSSARAANCILVSIAHNQGGGSVYYPGRYDSVICLAGLDDESLEIAGTSNYGEGVDFCAPYGAVTAYFYQDNPIYNYYIVTGTSMAAPQIAALIGTMLAINPALTWAEVYNILRRSCIPEIPRGGTRYGHGIPQFGRAIQYAIDSTHYSGFYSAEGYIRGLYKGGANGEPIRIGAAYYGDQDGTPRKFWVGTA